MDANGVHVTANFRPDKYNYAHNKRDEKFNTQISNANKYFAQK